MYRDERRAALQTAIKEFRDSTLVNEMVKRAPRVPRTKESYQEAARKAKETRARNKAESLGVVFPWEGYFE